jgi:hypothetical protein
MLKSRSMRWAGYVACMEVKRNACRIFVGHRDRKRPLGGPKHRWEDNIKTDLRETGWGGVGWIQLAWDRELWWALVNNIMNLWVA